MIKSIYSFLIGGLIVVGYTTGNVTNPEHTQGSPNQNMERISGSVSPRSEMEETNYAGSQTPGFANDSMVLEPMRSVTTRPAPDASSTDATGRR